MCMCGGWRGVGQRLLAKSFRLAPPRMWIMEDWFIPSKKKIGRTSEEAESP